MKIQNGAAPCEELRSLMRKGVFRIFLEQHLPELKSIIGSNNNGTANINDSMDNIVNSAEKQQLLI